jgi:Phosphoinositide 3-kinase family, accessory domain (PIK domain)
MPLIPYQQLQMMNPEPNQNDTSRSLAHFLIDRAAKNIQLATYLYWYLKVELMDPTYGPLYQEVFEDLKARLSSTPEPPEMIETSKGFMKLVASTIAEASGRESESTAHGPSES